MNKSSHKTILITGSSKGLGQKTALRLASEDTTIIINYHTDHIAAKETADQINSSGGHAIAIQADVRQEPDVNNMFRQIKKKTGSVDILINNVGDFVFKAFDETSFKEWQDMLSSNLNSCFLCCKAALPDMRLNKWGRIINIGLANAGVKAYQNVVPYSIAKTGVHILTKSLAKQEAPNGITVNIIAPGLMDNGRLSEEQLKMQASTVPMGRSGTAEDVLGAVQYLISEQAQYVTGTELVVSGGWGLS